MSETHLAAEGIPPINPALERMRKGQPALGLIVHLARSGEIARLAKLTGHDFLFIDRQHGVYSVETVAHIAQTALSCGVAPIVRARSVDDPDVQALLDNGVTGIIYPNVNNAEQARRAVTACKFAPIGGRSVARAYPNFNFANVPVDEEIRVLNETTLVIAMIETMEGMNNAEEIVAVPGVDVVHVGCSDLMIDMGMPGQLDAPVVWESVMKVTELCRKHGKFAGMGGVRSIERQVAYIENGVRFISTHSDAAFVTEGAARHASGIRSALERQKTPA